MSSEDQAPAPDREPRGQHLATISHEGRFWDVYLEFEEDARRPDSFRARLAFSPGDPADDEGMRRTTVVIIEDTFDDAIRKARGFDDRHLAALLRSLLD
jgi:hypothetical protein